MQFRVILGISVLSIVAACRGTAPTVEGKRATRSEPYSGSDVSGQITVRRHLLDALVSLRKDHDELERVASSLAIVASGFEIDVDVAELRRVETRLDVAIKQMDRDLSERRLEPIADTMSSVSADGEYLRGPMSRRIDDDGHVPSKHAAASLRDLGSRMFTTADGARRSIESVP